MATPSCAGFAQVFSFSFRFLSLCFAFLRYSHHRAGFSFFCGGHAGPPPAARLSRNSSIEGLKEFPADRSVANAGAFSACLIPGSASCRGHPRMHISVHTCRCRQYHMVRVFDTCD